MSRTSPVSAQPLARLAFAAFCLAAITVSAAPAEAQQIVARVNGVPITEVDVAQRMRLSQVSGSKAPNRKAIIDELIDEQLKLQTAHRYRIDIPESEVEQVVAGMAGRMRATPEQFAKVLGSAGISINALKRKLRADIAWNGIVRGKFQSRLQVREKDIFMAAKAQGKEQVASYDYSLRPILLVVPRGAGASVMEARRREAEGLRTRFTNCEDGLRLARGLRDVAIREPVTRSSSDLSAKLREVLDNTAVGRLTPPDVTQTGIEVFAVCSKTPSKGVITGAERDVREKLFGERFDAEAAKYLRQLRRQAAIELR